MQFNLALFYGTENLHLSTVGTETMPAQRGYYPWEDATQDLWSPHSNDTKHSWAQTQYGKHFYLPQCQHTFKIQNLTPRTNSHYENSWYRVKPLFCFFIYRWNYCLVGVLHVWQTSAKKQTFSPDNTVKTLHPVQKHICTNEQSRWWVDRRRTVKYSKASFLKHVSNSRSKGQVGSSATY